ncbi:uncharacterized protein LOC131437732 isoform X2 [Malaya genurostris]|uniref:uncharacterized protein LOC131437732 isoform X2 n=1 Tax=Malaya genurostris TaxID=325434 RepID=UPI0026F38E71|nr:uncharacterized protein LOC131437732 isoform X2 [Malaya genurostris]
MSFYIVIPVILFLLIIVWAVVYAIDKRYNRNRILETRAPNTDSSTIIYTIPTNQQGHPAQRSEAGSAILFPNRTSTYNLRPTIIDLPPSYEDVTKTATTPTTTTTSTA